MDSVDVPATAINEVSEPVEVDKGKETTTVVAAKEEEPAASATAAEPIISAPAVIEEKSDDLPPLRFTKPFLAAHTAYVKSRPHPETDLIDQYGVSWLARSVARTDPVTGEKINKMRKSYEGQIKAFGLAGRNKAVKWEQSHGHSILQLAQAPAEDYVNARVTGKEVANGLSSGTLSRLEKILELKPGPVPRNAEWEHALGFDKTKGVTEETKIKRPDQPRDGSQAPPRVNGHVNGTSSGKDSDIIRPKRAGKRRRYNDDSFEGYGEGFDEGDDGISDDGSRRSNGSRSKRQRVGSIG